MQLAAALSDGTMMIEADVSAGEDGQPIMAHPPDTQSDLSLDLFLETVLQATEGGAKKGIKLDFKSLDILQPSLETLQRLEARLVFPVWLNADILRGPGGKDPVSAEIFLQLCSRYLPSATLSTGFTTGSGEGEYSEEMMEELYQTMTNSGLTAPVTIPLRAALAARSGQEILSYLARVEHTITLWGGATDQVDLQLLYQLVRDVGADRVYVDVPFQYDPPPLPTQRQTRQLHNFLINSISSALSLFASIL